MNDATTTGAGLRASADCKTYASAESQLEAAIHAAHARICSAPTSDERRAAYDEMCALIEQRTPSRRRFMERMAGLT